VAAGSYAGAGVRPNESETRDGQHKQRRTSVYDRRSGEAVPDASADAPAVRADGLISPARIGSKNRVYSRADIERLMQIQHLTQDMGVNLAGVEVVLDLLDKMNRMRSEMENELDRMKRIAVEQARRIDDIIG